MNFVESSLLYNSLIRRAINRGLNKRDLSFYTESHHIIPTCVGGPNIKTNKVLLTASEHYIAHKLLCDIYSNNSSLQHAWWNMAHTNKGNRAYQISDAEYESARLAHSNAMKKLWQNKEWRAEVSKRIKIGLSHVKESRALAIKIGLAKPDSIKLRREISINLHKNLEIKEKHRNGLINSWINPDVRNRRIAGLIKKLAEPETKERQRRAAKESNNRPEKKKKISDSCKRTKRNNVIWSDPLKTDILKFWELNEKPGYVTFRKMAIKNGFPDANYNALINKHFIKELKL